MMIVIVHYDVQNKDCVRPTRRRTFTFVKSYRRLTLIFSLKSIGFPREFLRKKQNRLGSSIGYMDAAGLRGQNVS